jgi:hypothetical protein
VFKRACTTVLPLLLLILSGGRSVAQMSAFGSPTNLSGVPECIVSPVSWIGLGTLAPASVEFRRAYALSFDHPDAARRLFRKLQNSKPEDPLAFIGETQITKISGLPAEIHRYRALLASAAGHRGQEAALWFAIGYALNTFQDLLWLNDKRYAFTEEPRKCLFKAITIAPDNIVYRLGLAAIDTVDVHQNAQEARFQYEAVLKLRTDLKPTMLYLHAETWDLPFPKTQEQIKKRRAGNTYAEQMRPQNPRQAIAELKQLTAEYPKFYKGYQLIADNYAILGDRAEAVKYRSKTNTQARMSETFKQQP